jgi:hypothetical protein
MQIQTFDVNSGKWETIETTKHIRIVMHDSDYLFQLREVGERNLRVMLTGARVNHIATLPESSNHIILLPVDSSEGLW